MKKKNKITFIDGAMGTNLSAAGFSPSPKTNIDHPGEVKKIHLDFICAGADIIETNTFSATSLKYENFKEINREGVRLASEAVAESKRKSVKIAGSVGASGKMVKPLGELEFEEAVDIFKSQIEVLQKAGVDLLLIETMDDLSEFRAALIAAAETAGELPLIATMTFSQGERTSTGTPPEIAARVADTLGADIIGVNCSFGPAGLVEVVRRMRAVTKKPLAAQANAGMPQLAGGNTVFPETPEKYAQQAAELVKAGVSYIGGCCGTTKAHIVKLVETLKGISPAPGPQKVPLIISSRTEFRIFGEKPLLIGERINLVAHPGLKGSVDKMVREGLRQKKAGADALDVNTVTQKELTAEVAEAVNSRVGLPVVLDSQDEDTVRDVARRYPGILLLNSVSAEKEKSGLLLPVVKKYGMPYIGLCVSDEGVPRTVAEKLKVADHLIKEAAARGIDSGTIVIDPVVFAVSSDTSSAAETLKALQKIENHTVLGISNVSAGLPRRAVLNEIFSALAVGQGCSALIVNPLNADLVYGVYAASLLTGRDKNAEKYLNYFSAGSSDKFKFEEKLSQAIVEGDSAAALTRLEELLKETAPLDIINSAVVPALDRVGKEYDRKSIFLPQLIESAGAAEKVMEKIEKKLISGGGKMKSSGKILFATVKGDIHDIGKNLVALILKNHSFQIRDLGVDISSDEIVDTAIEWGADIVALSSLMTTTMEEMAEVVKLLKRKKAGIPVMVGGAAVRRDYAESIGAHYANDAIEAVKKAKEIA
ncbi:MAG: homocysteine S-methyltransferase family protein [Elusimicrobiota bacterium]|nr:homocysteine S-methyltransferase family protein [Elusimicrobiota bacterium]